MNVLHMGCVYMCAFVCVYVLRICCFPIPDQQCTFGGRRPAVPLHCVSCTVLGLDVADSQKSFRAWVQWDNIPGL